MDSYTSTVAMERMAHDITIFNDSVIQTSWKPCMQGL